MALRGLRPIAEIQYLDYLLYAIQIMSDDLATLQYRTVGKQKAPLIIRTRGHRLEGIWHSGLHGNHQCHKRNSRFGSEKYDKQSGGIFFFYNRLLGVKL
jgi:hypothetical protein